jgi:hypothetical protein
VAGIIGRRAGVFGELEIQLFLNYTFILVDSNDAEVSISDAVCPI